MSNDTDDVLHYVPEDRNGSDEELIERFMTRVNHPMRGGRPERPRRRRVEGALWPWKAEPRAVQQHNDRLDQIEFIGEQNEYIIQMGLFLEYVAFKEGVGTVVSEVDVIKGLPPGSMPRVFAEEHLLDGSDRIRNLCADVTEDYRAKLLG